MAMFSQAEPAHDFNKFYRGCQMGLLGKRLHELRGSLSLHEVGKGSGVPSADLGRYEKEDYHPTKPTLKKLSEYFEVPYEELRFLHYEDFFKEDSEELDVIVKWACSKNFTAAELVLVEKLRQVPQDRQADVCERFTQLIEELESSN